MPFSQHAAARPPTKLGVKAGGSASVETIIYSLVTKSANDSAAAIAEYLGGSEDGFARMMTAKARKLGMSGTIFRTPRDCPSAQHSTARDLAILGMALREHFPQYYSLFLDPLVHLRPAAHGQSQPPARPREGHGRHQDRLYPRFGLQPGLVGLATASAASSQW